VKDVKVAYLFQVGKTCSALRGMASGGRFVPTLTQRMKGYVTCEFTIERVRTNVIRDHLDRPIFWIEHDVIIAPTANARTVRHLARAHDLSAAISWLENRLRNRRGILAWDGPELA
jgi:hypothetical protein